MPDQSISRLKKIIHSYYHYFVFSFNEQDYAEFNKAYSKDRSAITFLSNYEANDVAAVILGPQSTSLWIISPPDLKRLKDDLASNVTLKVQFKYVVSRVTNTEKIAGTVTGERSFDLKDDTPARSELLNMLKNISTSDKRSQLPFLFPKFLKVISFPFAQSQFVSCLIFLSSFSFIKTNIYVDKIL